MKWPLLKFNSGSISFNKLSIGNTFQFCKHLKRLRWVQMHITLKVSFWMPWANMGALQIRPWLPSEFVLDVMVICCFKAFSMGRLHKQGSKLHLTSLVRIAWHIKLTWLSLFWPKCHWLHALKICYNIYILFFTWSREGTKICEPCQKYQKQKN